MEGFSFFVKILKYHPASPSHQWQAWWLSATNLSATWAGANFQASSSPKCRRTALKRLRPAGRPRGCSSVCAALAKPSEPGNLFFANKTPRHIFVFSVFGVVIFFSRCGYIHVTPVTPEAAGGHFSRVAAACREFPVLQWRSNF